MKHRHHSTSFAAAVAVAVAAFPAQAATITIPVQNPVVELTLTETVQSAPDTAVVGAGVQVRASTASEAMRRNAEQMDKVIARLRQIGIERKDIQTANFSLNAQYQYRNDGQQPVFLGYEASNMVSVTLRKLDKVGDALDALVAAGANNLYGPNFSLENDRTAKAEARKLAFRQAEAQGREYARMAGFSGLRLLEISETFAQSGAMPVSPRAIDVTSAKAEATTPVEPGRVGTAATVTVKYEMTR